MKYLDNKVLVTGGANGIGKSIALHFQREGASVIIADKDKEKGQEMEQTHDKMTFHKTDLADPDAILKMFQHLKVKGDVPNILINNAGLSRFIPLLDIKIEEWDEILSVNLRSYFICAREFVRLNQGKPYGRIVNIASTRAIMSEPNSEAYAASKGGILALTHALALSTRGSGITVNSISPGWIKTTGYKNLSEKAHGQHPSGRVGKPADIAKLCLYLCEKDNNFINGENILVDGGMTRKMIYEA
jgi:hypothetical protein